MIWLSALAYLADAVLISAYWWLVRGHSERPYHWANALGAVPLLAVEITARAWPLVPITGMFGVVGWIGVLSGD